MTVSDLKRLYGRNDSGGHFFDRKTMRFFGDTMRNFGVRDGGKVRTVTASGIEDVEVWDLYRKRPVAGGLYGHCRYFSKSTGREIFSCLRPGMATNTEEQLCQERKL